MRLKILEISAAALLTAVAPSASAAQKLTVYTYESFTAEWGPGPRVEKAFEATCGCDLEFVPVADGVALLNRLKLEGGVAKADIVLGLDTNLASEALETGLFAPHGIDLGNIDVPGGWSDETFVPYDYGHFAVIYDTEKIGDAPSSLADLVALAGDAKIVIQDPRTSTPGLGLVLWLRFVYGDDAPKAWSGLKDSILTVTPGWSEAYGLFTGGEAEMVLSYTTSPAYHMIAEGSDRYRAAAFAEGHYMQIEVAGTTVKGAGNELSAKFLSFMTGPEFQDIIPETNWMFPAGRTGKPLHPVFGRLVKPSRTLLFGADEVAENRKAWVDEWLEAMGH